MRVRGLAAAMVGLAVLAGCSTAEPYSTERQLLAQQARVVVPMRPSEPLFQVGPRGPRMSERELEAEKLRRMRARVLTNPGLAGKIERYGMDDGGYGDVLRR